MADVSVVIRTFNEQKHLPALLDVVRRQESVSAEIIVVDSGSYDHTCEIAEAGADRLVHVDSNDFTFGYSLNVGLSHASARLVAIVSAHTLPVNGLWLGALVEPLRDAQTAMVYGRQLGADASKFSETQDFLRTFGEERQALSPPRFFANNANAAVRKDLWEQHSFDERLPGLEDIEWARHWMTQGYRVVYEPAAAIYHIHEETWPQVKRRYYREAVAARYLGLKGRRDAFSEAAHELWHCAGDLVAAGRHRVLRERAPEIIRFRAQKALGTIGGLLDGTAVTGMVSRDKYLFDRTSKAVVIHGPGKASLDDVQVPTIKPGDVLIKVAYEGVCATDLEIFDGGLGYYKSGFAKYPIVPGHEFSGRIVKVGANVPELHPGDGVVVECIQSCGRCAACARGNWIACVQRQEVGVIGRDGGYAEYVVSPARFVHKLPAGMDLRRAALCEPLAVVLKGIRRVGELLEDGDRHVCAVIGAGPLGQLCALVLAARGQDVTAFDQDPARLKCLAGTSVKTSSGLDELRDFDILVEATGKVEALESILARSAAGTTLLLLGLPYAHRDFSFESIVAYDRTVVGSVGSSAQDFADAVEMAPRLSLERFTEHVVPLASFEAAWHDARERKHLKTLLEVDGSL